MSEIEKQEAKGRKRNVQINIRISEAEAEQLRKKVEQSGMSQQEYILSCVLNKPITNTDGIKISIHAPTRGATYCKFPKWLAI